MKFEDGLAAYPVLPAARKAADELQNLLHYLTPPDPATSDAFREDFGDPEPARGTVKRCFDSVQSLLNHHDSEYVVQDCDGRVWLEAARAEQ